MRETFDRSAFFGCLARGKLREAMDYLGRLPEEAGLYQKYVSLFREERYLTYDVDGTLNRILLAYQKYYREAFYLELPPEEAAGGLERRLAGLLDGAPGRSLEELDALAAEAFRRGGYYALGGKTGGYYGPYIWRTEELRHYAVALPGGTRDYAVKLLDGFVMKSWMDYLSFGVMGTGGWANGDGLIHCVREAYDLESEDFRVSLLKHEAQHAADLERYGSVSSQDLEYRAKLVELIYSRERNLLEKFLGEADAASAGNGHSLAAERILRGFGARLDRGRGALAGLPVEEARAIALALFRESAGEMERKYLNGAG